MKDEGLFNKISIINRSPQGLKSKVLRLLNSSFFPLPSSLFPLSLERQINREGAAFALCTLHFDAAVVEVHDFLDIS